MASEPGSCISGTGGPWSPSAPHCTSDNVGAVEVLDQVAGTLVELLPLHSRSALPAPGGQSLEIASQAPLLSMVVGRPWQETRVGGERVWGVSTQAQLCPAVGGPSHTPVLVGFSPPVPSGLGR